MREHLRFRLRPLRRRMFKRMPWMERLRHATRLDNAKLLKQALCQRFERALLDQRRNGFRLA